MSKYRFKTEKEFKRDSLWIKDHPNGWTSSGSMNKYLGTDIPDKYNGICDRHEKVHYDTWSFMPEDYVLKETSFVLPSEWCIKVDRNCQPEEVYKWRDISWVDAGYINYTAAWTGGIKRNHTEITLEQFKQHVLKESPVVETIVETLNQEEDYTGRTIKALVKSPQGTGVQLGEVIKILIKENKDTYILDITARGANNMRINIPLDLSDWELLPESPKEIGMKDIQEEAKKRFPIGCKFIPVDGVTTYTLLEDSCTYEIRGKQIYAHDCHGTLYNNGKWATLVSLPETTKEMFYAGDYIVTLINDANCGKVNYCSKQSKDSDYLQPVIDTKGYPNNVNSKFLSTDTSNTKWRYATQEEAAEYERIGKPYDVTTLQKKEESIPEYVECIEVPRGWGITEKGVIYKIDSFESVTGYFRLIFDKGGQRVTSEKHCFKPSTKEAYEAQFVSKELTQEDLVKGEIYIYDGSQISTYPEGPSISIDEQRYTSNPKWMWSLSITHATEEQKALLRGEIEKRDKKTFKSEYIPQVGDYVVMENAGGWGYHPDNNGCIAIVEKVSTREVGFGSDSIIVRSIGGQIINAKTLGNVTFNNVPIIGHEKQLVFRKALPHEIPSDLPKKTVIEEWSEGTYAVGVKGNFGVYTEADNLVPVGRIFTIKENRENNLVVKDYAFWIYKKNLRWFATYEEALNFSNQLKASPPPMWSSDPIVEQKISTPSIKKETFIEDVQSVDVMLRTKRKSIKF